MIITDVYQSLGFDGYGYRTEIEKVISDNVGRTEIVYQLKDHIRSLS